MKNNTAFDVHETISATEVVRNFSAAIDKVRYTGKNLYITKGSKTIAALSPPPKSGLPVACLEELLTSAPKLRDDAAAFAKGIKQLHDSATTPDDSWES
ncbi:MAG: hypothetical protein P1U74_00705 [Legionellaceae bacterium]|nr:hypothetical protein [Legionellaceae bacterium]